MCHIISAEGITADPEKVKAIVCARAPTNVSELRGLLGLGQYVGRYVPDLATVTKKSVEFHWGPDQEKRFKKIQQLMSSCETLAYFDRNAPITLVADASPVGLGAVLLQEQGSINRVITYGIGFYLRWRVDIRKRNGRPWELCGHANTLRCIL